MRKIMAAILAIGMLCLSCFFLTGSTSPPSSINQDEILDVINNAYLLPLCPDNSIGDTSSSVSNRAALFPEIESPPVPISERYDVSQKEQIVDEYTDTLHDYYTDSSWAIQAYSESCTEVLDSTMISDNIDAGILSRQIDSITPNDDNTLTAKATLVSWVKCVDQMEDKFVSFVIVNRNTMTHHMKKEDDSWKIDSVTDYFKEFSPEDFDNGYGTYDTYEEAYEAISAFTVVNPF